MSDGRLLAFGVAAALAGATGFVRAASGSQARGQPDPFVDVVAWRKVVVRPSPIEGRGLFADEDIPNGTRIGPGLLRLRADGKGEDGEDLRQTTITRFVNHAIPSNVDFAVSQTPGITYDLVTTRAVRQGDELVADYDAYSAFVEATAHLARTGHTAHWHGTGASSDPAQPVAPGPAQGRESGGSRVRPGPRLRTNELAIGTVIDVWDLDLDRGHMTVKVAWDERSKAQFGRLPTSWWSDEDLAIGDRVEAHPGDQFVRKSRREGSKRGSQVRPGPRLEAATRGRRWKKLRNILADTLKTLPRASFDRWIRLEQLSYEADDETDASHEDAWSYEDWLKDAVTGWEAQPDPRREHVRLRHTIRSASAPFATQIVETGHPYPYEDAATRIADDVSAREGWSPWRFQEGEKVRWAANTEWSKRSLDPGARKAAGTGTITDRAVGWRHPSGHWLVDQGRPAEPDEPSYRVVFQSGKGWFSGENLARVGSHGKKGSPVRPGPRLAPGVRETPPPGEAPPAWPVREAPPVWPEKGDRIWMQAGVVARSRATGSAVRPGPRLATAGRQDALRAAQQKLPSRKVVRVEDIQTASERRRYNIAVGRKVIVAAHDGSTLSAESGNEGWPIGRVGKITWRQSDRGAGDFVYVRFSEDDDPHRLWLVTAIFVPDPNAMIPQGSKVRPGPRLRPTGLPPVDDPLSPAARTVRVRTELALDRLRDKSIDGFEHALALLLFKDPVIASTVGQYRWPPGDPTGQLRFGHPTFPADPDWVHSAHEAFDQAEWWHVVEAHKTLVDDGVYGFDDAIDHLRQALDLDDDFQPKELR